MFRDFLTIVIQHRKNRIKIDHPFQFSKVSDDTVFIWNFIPTASELCRLRNNNLIEIKALPLSLNVDTRGNLVNRLTPVVFFNN